MVLFQDSMRAEEESFSKRSSLHFDTEYDESFKQIKCSSYEEINITETVNLPKEDNKIPQNSELSGKNGICIKQTSMLRE